MPASSGCARTCARATSRADFRDAPVTGNAEARRRRESRESTLIAMQHDFPSDIVEQVAHRPWPMPGGPWIMTQSWHDLLFAHWPVVVRTLRSKIPPGVELDLFDHQAWLGILPFR